MTTVEESEEVQRRPRASDRLVGAVPGPARNVVLEVGQMCQLLGKVVYSAVRYPHDEIRHALAVGGGVPIVSCDARSRPDTKRVLVQLVEYAIDRHLAKKEQPTRGG